MSAVDAEQPRGLAVGGLALGVDVHRVPGPVGHVPRLVRPTDHVALPRIAQGPCPICTNLILTS